MGQLVGRSLAEDEEEDDGTSPTVHRTRTSPTGAFPSSASEPTLTRAVTVPAVISTGEDPAADLTYAVLADARDVLERFPSHAFSEAVRPSGEQRFTVELPSRVMWEETMVRLWRAGRWAFESHGEVLQRAGRPLGKLVRPLAHAAGLRQPLINFREGARFFAVGDAVCVYDSDAGGWVQDGEIVEVWVADAAASSESVPPGAVKVAFREGRATRVFTEGQAKRFLRRHCEEEEAADFVLPVSALVPASVGDSPDPETPEEEEARAHGRGQCVPNNLSTRIGGIYHETLAVRFPPGGPCPSVGAFVGTQVLHSEDDERRDELLTSCVVQVFGNRNESCGGLPTLLVGRHGRADTPDKAQQLYRMIKFAVARQAVVPQRPQPFRVRICSLLNALVLDKKERGFFQGQLSVLAEPARDGRQELEEPAAFDFASSMERLGADYSCLNFVANWPLCFRLGVGPPAGRHNASHARGLRRHLRWLAQDVLQSLESMPETCAPVGIQQQMRLLTELSAGESSMDPWSEGLQAVRAAIDLLRPFAETDAAMRESCRRFFMALELLGQLCKCQGTTFRRRAAELLQLCVLEHILGVTPFFNCKSGIDRTGILVSLWTTFHQLVSSRHPQLWLWHYLALAYPLLVKLVHGLHECGIEDVQGKRSVPLQQLHEGCFVSGGDSLLPFPPEPDSPEEVRLYAGVERLCALSSNTNAERASAFPEGNLANGGAERFVYLALEQLFFVGPHSLLPQFQAGFFANIFGVATKVAIASTGVHGLKYGDIRKNSGQFNSLAAQFMPKSVRCTEGGAGVTIAEVRKTFVSTEIAFAPDILPYLIGSSCGRGT